MLKIITYNVNGLRAAIRKGFTAWLQNNSFDVLALQEIKANTDQVNLAAFEHIGYYPFFFPAQRKGYAGVAILTRQKPSRVIYGMGIDKYDQEGRVMRVDLGNYTLINTYFPSGSFSPERQALKMDFLKDFSHYIKSLQKYRPHLIISGDLNICHKPIDIHNPQANAHTPGFLPEERDWLTQFLRTGFIDSLRVFNKKTGQYSWWSYRANARANNKGWRIDYHLVSRTLQRQLVDAKILAGVRHADHCPVFLKIIV